MRYLPVSDVRQGSTFIHYGQLYRRATEEEIKKHMCRFKLDKQPRLVLAYMLDKKGLVPVSFKPEEMANLPKNKRDLL